MQPEYIFETSWEVCNRVGGIYAVLSTRAASMQKEHKDKVVFFGPDFGEHSNLTFKESKTILKGWRPKGVRVGRWQVPGKPIAVLLKWDELWDEKDKILVICGRSMVFKAMLPMATTMRVAFSLMP